MIWKWYAASIVVINAMSTRLGQGALRSLGIAAAKLSAVGLMGIRVQLYCDFLSACFNHSLADMKSFLSLLLLGLIGLVQALSSTGNRLLVVLEEASDKAKYSSFWGQLECKSPPFILIHPHMI